MDAVQNRQETEAWYRHITLSMLAAPFLAVTAHIERARDEKGAPAPMQTI